MRPSTPSSPAAMATLRRARHAPGRGRHAVGARLLAGRRRASHVLDAKTGKRGRDAGADRIPTASSPGRSRGARKPFPYRLRLWDGRNDAWEAEDPYRFPPILGELDIHLMARGQPPPALSSGSARTRTTSTASTASPSRCGRRTRSGSAWSASSTSGTAAATRCASASRSGVWELFIPGVADGAHYKFELLGADGRLLPLKADPVGFRPRAAARHRLARRTACPSHDVARRATGWSARRERQALAAPISIYEVHLGSWRREERRPSS